MSAPVRYQNFLFDSARWDGFAFRPGDIIISTPAKCGTTWTQMICALLIFQTPTLDRPMDLISPWLEMRTRRREDVVADLEAQTQRRFIKSHTPLDGLPAAEGVTYIAVGRDPRDAAFSMGNHIANIEPEAFFAAITKAAEPGAVIEVPSGPPRPVVDGESFRAWLEEAADDVMGLAAVVGHLASFWAVRHRPDIVLLHYDDLQADLEGEMRPLAGRLGIEVAEDRWPELVRAAGFEEMRRNADRVAPDTSTGIWRSNRGFFHSGTSGQWRAVLGDDPGALAAYEARLRSLADPELITWLHHRSPLATGTPPPGAPPPPGGHAPPGPAGAG